MTDDRVVDGLDAYRGQDGPRTALPDWGLVVGDPRIRIVAVKATQGTGWVDTEFQASWAALRRLVPNPSGEPHSPWLVAYHFRTDEDVVAQATHFRQTVGVLRVGEGVAVDCEPDPAGKFGAGSYGDQRAICAVVGQMFDRNTIRYGNDSPWLFDPFVKWTARYRPEKPTYACALWQWGGAVVPGIHTPGIHPEVDANRILDGAVLARAFYPLSEEKDMTPDQAKKLDEVHSMLELLTKGAPVFGVSPTPTNVEYTHRMVSGLAKASGVKVEP